MVESFFFHFFTRPNLITKARLSLTPLSHVAQNASAKHKARGSEATDNVSAKPEGAKQMRMQVRSTNPEQSDRECKRKARSLSDRLMGALCAGRFCVQVRLPAQAIFFFVLMMVARRAGAQASANREH